MPNHDETTFWKRKLAAFLHDPPSKALDIRTHAERSEKAMQAAGLGTTDERRSWERTSDHTAAAADRFPFPHHAKTKLTCVFDGLRNQFRHPLDGEHRLAFDGPFLTAEEGIEGEQTTQPIIHNLENLPEEEQWRARFFAHWRLWQGASASKDWRLAYLPADTRIPDHTIWNHMQMVSALDGCATSTGSLSPAFLKFQIGPVQEFIQAARSTRDLWSGSYLLSWLMAHGMAALALRIGPDSVIFPNLRDQPLIDIAMKEPLWDRVRVGDKSVWNSHGSLRWSTAQLLTPNLPNVFLAVVPSDRAATLAREVESAIQEEWKRIAASVWKHCEDNGLWELDNGLQPMEQRRQRFDHQVSAFLSQSWSVSDWPETLEEVERLATQLPETTPTRNYHAVKAAAQAIRDYGHQDDRYFDAGGSLRNIGLAWALLVARSSWHLDSVRQTRGFTANIAATTPGRQQTKDSLTGKEEAVAGGVGWRDDSRFKHDGDYLAAPTLVKRLWDKTYLHERWKDVLGEMPQAMPNTRDLAAGRPEINSSDDDSPAETGDRYFAVLAFDGDDMGKWISGEKTPPFASQLADYEGGGALEYFRRPGHHETFQSFLEAPRPISPGYHLQFSECLSNFALRCARSIVEAHNGRLVYAGGDDVLALLPADTALACANDLQRAFKGESPLNRKTGIQQKSPGFLTSVLHQQSTGMIHGSNEALIPFMVPGPSAGASVGIAIAHFKSPLQDAVRAAQAAEKRAKKLPGKAAVAVTVMKRSGESIEWTARWEDAGVLAATTLIDALRQGVVSSKFPYRLGELVSAYGVQSSGVMRPFQPVAGFDLAAVFAKELGAVASRQRGPNWDERGAEFEKNFSQQMSQWIESMRPIRAAGAATSVSDLGRAIHQVQALCAFCGFAIRQEPSAHAGNQAAS
jgi:hypothetical protein